MTNDMLVSRGAGLIEAEAGDEMLGLHIENGSFYRFNQTAARIWALIEQPKTVAVLCATLAREFKVDPVTCERDVSALLVDLAADGLVKID